ncbi:MAG: hypothetical protein ACO3BI_03350 [Candidatus Nanopelagicales bacterium]
MNLDDFESRFKKHDPASSVDANLTPSQMLNKAMDREVGNVVPISTWSRKRKAISAVAAGLLFVGVTGPLMSGAMTADGPDRFVFGSSPVANESMRLGNADSLASSDMKIGLPFYYGYNIFESDISLSNETTSMMTYSVVARDDAEQVGRNLARTFGISKLTASDYDEDVLIFENDNKYFSIYLSDSFTSVNYSDYTNDPWRECYVEVRDPDGTTSSTNVEECEPKAENLPSQSEAKRLATNLFKSIGIDSTDFKFEIWADQAFVSVTATEYLNEHMTPVSWNVTYTSNSEISWLYASLTELKELSEYDVISEADALKRINELNSSRIFEYQNDSGAVIDVEPTYSDEAQGSDSNSGSSDGSSVEPNPGTTDDTFKTSEPIVDPMYTSEPQVVHVTRVELTYETFWLEDGTVVWLPTYQFFGYVKGGEVDETYPIGTIVGLADDVIDLKSLYGVSISARMQD